MAKRTKEQLAKKLQAWIKKHGGPTASLSAIRPNPDNPRTITEDALHKLCCQLADMPQTLQARCIVYDERGIILGGNMRYAALGELGIAEVPENWLYCLEGLTDEQKQQFILLDNTGAGQWNWDILANEWNSDLIADWGPVVPGWDVSAGEEEEQHLEAAEDDYDVPAGGLATDIILGDLFEIGPHRLLCGDSTDSDAVNKLMGGEKADVAHNDPPYGMKKEAVGVINDNLNYSKLLEFNIQWIPVQFSHIKENGSWYCWGIDEPLMDIYSGIIKPYIEKQKATFRNLITWDKAHGQGQNSDLIRSYATADEKCLFVMMGVQGFNINADNYFEGWEPIRDYLLKSRLAMGWDVPTMKRIVGHSDLSRNHWTSKSQFNMPTREVYEKMKSAADAIRAKTGNDAFKKEYDELKKEYYSTRAYFNNTHDNMNNVWHFTRHNKDGTEGNHATPKPIPLCERVIKSSCPDNGLVIDFFLGSGSTMVAAHQLNRKCYGMELEPKYCQVIVDRMLKLDPSLSIKRNGKPYQPTQP